MICSIPPIVVRPVLRAALTILAVGFPIHTAAADIVFVNAAQNLPTILQNGSNWAFAFKSLQTALLNAQSGDEVWVAQGVYLPSTNSTQTDSFTPPDGVRVLGGFQPGDLLESDRDPVANVTLLSGEIGAAGTIDNSQHIMRATGVSGTEIDGFVFANGNADGGGTNSMGGALLVDGPAGQTDIVVRGCTFVSNAASSGGGAVGIQVGNVSFIDCTFRNNAANNGGAIDAAAGPVVFANCRLLGNDANLGGALRMSNADGSLLLGCLFAGNHADNAGGAAQFGGSDVLIQNCTVAQNSAGASGGGFRFDSDMVAAIRNSILFGNTLNGAPSQIAFGALITIQQSYCDVQGGPTDGLGNFSADPLFVNAVGADGVIGTDDDDFRLSNASPCVDRGEGTSDMLDVADVDNDGNFTEQLPIDLAGAPRMTDDIVNDEGAGTIPFLDVGAYELNRPGTTLCVNAAASAGGDGTTWAKALNSLASALASANTQSLPAPVQIWVAAGTYKPTTDSNRLASFKIEKPLAIYGSFNGSEGSLLNRFPQANISILSGDIGVAGEVNDNSFHVIDAFVPAATTAIVDGFFIMHGNANGGSIPVGGGGARISTGGGASMRFNHCRFFANRGVTGAGLSASGVGTTTVCNSHVAGNVSSAGGGGAAATGTGGTLEVVNSTVLGNSASTGGGVLAQNSTTIRVRNSIVYFNQATATAGESEQISVLSTAAGTIEHSCVQCLGQNSSVDSATNCIGTDPLLINPDGEDETYGSLDDLVQLRSFSPCIDAGSTALIATDVGDGDEDGSSTDSMAFDISIQGDRIFDDTSVANGPGGAVDIGAVERANSSFGATPKPADFDGDGIVGPVDLAILLGAFGSSGSAGDVNFDCAVDATDLALLLGAWS
jgi:hypothetical protein